MVLPGHGLSEHDFFYAGESRDRKAFIVKGGQIIWRYEDPAGRGEISDAVLLSSGNILLAHQFAVEMITAEKKVLWKYDAPQGYEIHTAVPIGSDKVLFIQNGPEPGVKVFNIVNNQQLAAFALPVKNTKSTHGQFRHARLTADGTLMVAHMDMGKVCEYDNDGKELWSAPVDGVWGVTPLKGGNILVTSRRGVQEINREKKVVWEVTRAELPDYELTNLQLAWRLPNGNTLFNTWVNEWNGKIDHGSAPVQALEVTPDKHVVWALRSWMPPADLGPATTIQLLDLPERAEDCHFGKIH